MDIPGAWEDAKGRIILWGIPVQPASVVNISAEAKLPGFYIFGQNFFRTGDFPISSTFKRNITGNAEEFLLGAVSVMLIAALSEVVQATLMHTKRRKDGRVSRRGVQIAFMIDEIYHFRNVFSHVMGRKKRGSSGKDNAATTRVITSLIVLCITGTLMAADVFAVYLTQPSTTHSWKENQYNLRGIQPISTDRGLTKWVTRLSRDRSCVIPSFRKADQNREYSLSACVMYDVTEAHAEVTDIIEEVKVRSFFHKAGSEHFVTFGDAAITIKKRTFMYVNSFGGRDAFSTRITYETNDTDDFEVTKYIHELFIYSVLEVNCNHEEAKVTCKERVKQIKASPGEHRIVEQDIILWRTRKGPLKSLVRGLESTYRISLDNPFISVDDGINPLVATAAIEEVRGPGTYVNMTHENVQSDIRGLLSEEGRVAGLLALLSILGFLVLLLIILRFFLKPISLSELAWEARQNHLKPCSEICDNEEARQRDNNSFSSGLDLDGFSLQENTESAHGDPQGGDEGMGSCQGKV